MTLGSRREHLPQARRHILTVILAGLAAAVLLGGCGSGGGGTATAPSGSSATSAQTTPDAAPATAWTRQNSESALINAQLKSVTFIDALHGWAVGGGNDASTGTIAPIILATSDGGVTWKVQDAGAARSKTTLFSVAFADPAHGWAVGWGIGTGSIAPIILATSDGGATWNAQDAGGVGDAGALVSVAFVDAAHGWAVGEVIQGSATPVAIAIATSDGGATWNAQDASAAGSGAELFSVSFVDAEHGWAVGYRTDSSGHFAPVILATGDGGSTWTAQDASSAGATTRLMSVKFVDAEHGWAVGEDYRTMIDSTPVILATSDGGSTWEAQDLSGATSNAELDAVTFVDATHGWVVGIGTSAINDKPGPVILATTDGGATWEAQDPASVGSNARLSSVTFVDAARGWAVGVDAKRDSSALILATGE